MPTFPDANPRLYLRPINARLGNVPVVIAAHEDAVDTATIMELGVRRNEYVTRLSDYQQLECLVDYLLTGKPRAA